MLAKGACRSQLAPPASRGSSQQPLVPNRQHAFPSSWGGVWMIVLLASLAELPGPPAAGLPGAQPAPAYGRPCAETIGFPARQLPLAQQGHPCFGAAAHRRVVCRHVQQVRALTQKAQLTLLHPWACLPAAPVLPQLQEAGPRDPLTPGVTDRHWQCHICSLQHKRSARCPGPTCQKGTGLTTLCPLLRAGWPPPVTH